jgi:hypothetical protein
MGKITTEYSRTQATCGENHGVLTERIAYLLSVHAAILP